MMGDPLRKRQRLDLSDLKPAGGGAGGGDGGEGGVNPHTGQAYSRRYHEILSKRRGLPVYEFLDDLLGKVKKNQVGGVLVCVLGCLGPRARRRGGGGPANRRVCQPLAFPLASSRSLLTSPYLRRRRWWWWRARPGRARRRRSRSSWWTRGTPR